MGLIDDEAIENLAKKLKAAKEGIDFFNNRCIALQNKVDYLEKERNKYKKNFWFKCFKKLSIL